MTICWSHGENFYNLQIKTVLDKVYRLNRRKIKNSIAAVGFKWMLNQVMLLAYVSLESNLQSHIDLSCLEALKFLSAPQRILISGDLDKHTRPLSQQIENCRTVVKVIKRTKYRRFIARCQ
ncbi:hypothetical protein IEQ34_011267 [Dendrobium chrysotoxum]|uniref:Uncharacterized protein n=1 Tax=Dendrobium chrysotoxum TaxID=161865 RepID=A0AAV7GFQ4_DENCH|nr:hypothetical protein IEQ34_011267 [Dendrobium chrysotoxum]